MLEDTNGNNVPLLSKKCLGWFCDDREKCSLYVGEAYGSLINWFQPMTSDIEAGCPYKIPREEICD